MRTGLRRFVRMGWGGLLAAGLMLAPLSGPTASGAESLSLPEGLVLKAPVVPPALPPSLRALHEKLSQDLEPKDNAAVLLVQTFGADAFEPQLRDVSLDLLGIEALSEKAPEFLFLEEYVQSLGTVAPENVRTAALELDGQVQEGWLKPWKPVERPELAAYLQANDRALDAVVAASERPRYYAPMLPEDEKSGLISASWVIERRLPFQAKMLASRAMLRVAEGEFEKALGDIWACHRLASLLANGSPFDVSIVRASEIDGIACQTELNLLADGELSADQVGLMRKKFEKLPPLSNSGVAAQVGERAVLHREIELLRIDEALREEFFQPEAKPGEEKPAPVKVPTVDWKVAVERADELQDEVAEALATTDRAAQEEQFKKLEADFAAWDKGVDAKIDEIARADSVDEKELSRWLGETMSMSVRPVYRMRRMTDDRTKMRRDLVAVSMALVSYRHAEGKYPDALGDLSPKYLEKVPLDANSETSFLYEHPTKESVRLMSLGADGRNNAGEFYSDDMVVELD